MYIRGDGILVHSTQAKFYHELRTGQTNNNDLICYSGSVTNGERKFPGQRDSNPGDPYLGNTDNGAFVGRLKLGGKKNQNSQELFSTYCFIIVLIINL